MECSKSSHEAVLNTNSQSIVIAWGQCRQILDLLYCRTHRVKQYVWRAKCASSHWSWKTQSSYFKFAICLFFYRTLIEHTKALDPTRPVTYVTDSNYARDQGVSLYSTHFNVNSMSKWKPAQHTDYLSRLLFDPLVVIILYWCKCCQYCMYRTFLQWEQKVFFPCVKSNVHILFLLTPSLIAVM